MKRHHLLAITTLVASFQWFGANPAQAVYLPPDCPVPFFDAVTECQLLSGTFPVTGTLNFNKKVHFLAGSHLDATGGGITLNIDGNPGLDLTMEGGAAMLEANDPLSPSGGSASPITITVSGNMLMQPGSAITAEDDTDGGSGANITITVHGNYMTLCGTTGTTTNPPPGCTAGSPGARISSEKNAGAGDTGKAGNITIALGSTPPTIPPTGVFTMEPGTIVSANSTGSAGAIKITAGKEMDIDGSVLSESTLSGTGAVQAPGGGTITLISGCVLTISDEGKVSSKGQDPGADLVHLEACEVVINGLVQSITTAGHANPNNPANHCNDDNVVAHPLGGATAFTACVEVWANNITINSILPHKGEVNADGERAPDRAWIDLFAFHDITINNDGTGPFAVHANGEPSTNTFGGVITVKAKTGKVTTSGLAIQADSNAPTAAGGNGGTVVVEAGGAGSPNGDVAFGAATVEAIGHTGSTADSGGSIAARSFQGKITGSAPGLLDAHGDDGTHPGIITLTACLMDPAVTYIAAGGTTNPAAGTFVVCPGPTMPTFPANVGGPGATFFFDTAHQQLWAACAFGPGGKKSGVKFNDLAGDGIKDLTDPTLDGWVIHVINSSGADAPGSPITTGAMSPGSGSYTFANLSAGTYTVCEELKTGWTQTFPTVAPIGETLATDCGTLGLGLGLVFGTNGYRFTVSTGNEKFENNDFGNHMTTTCKEDPNRAASITRTVDPSGTFHGGLANYLTVQAAYDAAQASALANEVIGLFGNTTENITMGGSKGLIITQCTLARVTAKNNSLPVWNITGTGKNTIISPDSVGGTIGWRVQSSSQNLKSIRAYSASLYGVQIIGSSNSVSFNSVSGSPEGVRIEGGSNTIKSGTISGNGIGVHLTSTATGNNVSGGTVQGNTGDGIFVEGSGNTLDSEKVYGNGGNGVHTTASATSTTLKGVSSGNPENNGAEFLLGVVAINGTGNKADGKSIPASTKCPHFPTLAAPENGVCE